MICDIEEALDEARMRSGYAALASYDEGDVVKVGDTTGVVTALMKENFKFPTGEDEKEDVEASSDNPVYIVALESGGAAAVSEDELSEGSFDDEEDVDPKKLAEDGEEASIYREMDNPHSIEELINIRGAKDPHVGFSSLPNGWTRATVLKAWASLGGTWTSCRREMVGDIRSPKRFCSAMKDELYGTTYWRGKF